MNRRDFLLTSAALAAVTPALADDAVNVSHEAQALYQKALVFDANAFPPLNGDFPFPQSQLDMTRDSGVTAVKSSLGGFNNSFEDTLGEIAGFQRVIEQYPTLFMQIRKAPDFAFAKSSGRMGIVFSFEAVTPLDGKIERIELFRNFGVMVMQISYNIESPFGTGVMGNPAARLTPLGAKAVAEMNKQGVALDLSHSNEATAMDAIAASAKPVLITHAGCKAVHDHPRNKSDALLKAIADKGGVVGIYDLPYLTASPKQPTLDDYMAHMTHALAICGEDHVGIGSDSSIAPWDTSPEATAAFNKDEEDRHKAGVAAPEEDRPMYVEGLNTPRRCEVIADALLKRGYKARVAEKVLGQNFIGTLGRIW
ncbi:MAG TPA: membrane dipeptidase [Rhizomicrobium sp.]